LSSGRSVENAKNAKESFPQGICGNCGKLPPFFPWRDADFAVFLQKSPEFSTASTKGLWKTQFFKNSSFCTKLPRKVMRAPPPFLEKGFFYRFFLPPPRGFLSVFG
jgi:hypothetical protein